MKKEKLKKEIEVAEKHYGKDGYVTDDKTGRPLFMYRHPNFPLWVSIGSLSLVLCKPILVGMLQWLQTMLLR